MANIAREVVISLVSAAALAAGSLAWNWTSEGGIIRLLGGITRAEFESNTNEGKSQIISLRKDMREATNILLSGNQRCPPDFANAGTILVGSSNRDTGSLQLIFEIAVSTPFPGGASTAGYLVSYPTLCRRLPPR